MYPYPTDLPKDDILNLIAVIKDKQLKEHRQSAGKSIWVIEGYILGRTLGEPTPTGTMQSFHWPSLPVPPTRDIIEVLEKIIDSPAGELALDFIPFPLHVLLKWLMNIALEMM